MKARWFLRKDLQRLRRDPAGLALWTGIPLVIGALIALASGGRGGTRLVARMLVADHDGGLAGRLLLGALGQGELGGKSPVDIEVEQVDEEAGRARVRAGEGSGLLVIPAGFGGAIVRGEPAALQLYTNPAQRILPGILTGMLQMFVDATFYLQQLAGPELREIAAGPPQGERTLTDLRVAALAARGNQLARRLIDRLDPLPFEFVDRSPEPPAAGGQRGFGAMFWPGILLMALFFVAQGLGLDLWEERRLGTLKRALAAPAGLRPFLVGKLLTAAAVAFAVGCVGLGVGVALFGFPAAVLLAGAPWVALSGTAVLLLLWPVICLAGTARGANVLTSSLGFPALMLGGSFFPFESMPAWMAAIGKATPNGWLLLRLRALVDGVFEPLELLLGVLGAALLAALVVPFCSRRLRAMVTG